MKPRREYSWRHTKAASDGLVRDAQRDARHEEVLWRLHQIGQHNVFRMLITYQRVHRKTDGWVRYCFREIFGSEPPRDRNVEELDFYIVEEFLAYRKKPWRTVESEKPAPLLTVEDILENGDEH